MDTPVPDPAPDLGWVTFGCALCGDDAGRVGLSVGGSGTNPALSALAELDAVIRPDGQQALLVQAFFGVAMHPVSTDRIDAVISALIAADASALYRIAYAYAPFHCPDCAASFCGTHWDWQTFEDDPYSGVEGRCPNGHFHVLAY